MQRTEDAYQQVLRGIDEGDPAVLDPIEPPAIGAAGYDQADLARDPGAPSPSGNQIPGNLAPGRSVPHR